MSPSRTRRRLIWTSACPLPVTAPLKGVVLADSTDGKPVAGAFLQGKLADQPWPFGAVADDKGRFVTDSPAGKRFL